MKKFYLKASLVCALLTSAMAANAQVAPKVPGETPVSGKQYVLFNKAQNSNQYMSRTSWDGAVYFLDKSGSNYASHAVTAMKNEDGSWTFSQTTSATDEEGNTTESTYYMAIPFGTCNLNIKSEEPAVWTLSEGDGAGYYRMTAGEGNNTNTIGMQLHLNAGGQYFVISEQVDGGGWWPDIYGGADQWEDESVGELYATPRDYSSFNWAFVQPANVDAYVQDKEVVSLINGLKNNECEIEDYAAGFTATYEAAAKIYEADEYDIDYDLERIISMVTSKKLLYNEIEAAIAINETDDAVLNAAIANAKNAFDTLTDGDGVTGAIEALKNAEMAYSLGSGDITALGKNMSFEDLSSQGGGETTGVAGAPAGWNVFINGVQAVTADEVRAGGISAWHGINSDSSGEIKDGKMAFGIWTSGVPTYELSQTIEGLENGTYVITAGLMAGSNGNGSRLTTQRIFGNLNSTYYASEFDYNIDKLDQTEVYDFAQNELISTDTEMCPVEVRAYVYDGTLTFGIRTNGDFTANNRTSGNGAGGDGWFKVDNFKLQSLGYIPEDALRVFDHFSNSLQTYYGDGTPMASSMWEKLEAGIGSLSGISEASTQEEVINGIMIAKGMMSDIDASVKAYEKLIAAIETHYEYLEQYSNKMGAGEYSDVIMEAQDAYADGTVQTPEEVEAIIAGLNDALQACIQSDEIEEGADLTEYIKNPSFEDLSAQGNSNSNGVAAPPAGWNLVIEGNECKTAPDVASASGAGWCAINGGDVLNDVYNTAGEPVYVQYTDGEHLWGLWANAVPVLELSQTITGLPAGTYTLTADIVVQNDWAGANLGMQRLFANDYVTMFAAEEDYIQNTDPELYDTFPADVIAAKKIDDENADAEVKHLVYAGNYSYENYGASGAPYTTTVQFGLADKGDIKFGFRTSRISAVDGQLSSQASMGWFKLDNFHLTYDSATVPAGAEATEINSVSTAASTPIEFYSISGARLAAPQKGVNIMKMANGTVQKVIMK